MDRDLHAAAGHGMPTRRIRAYGELVREGDGNEADRLALLEAHGEEVRERLAEVSRNFELIDYKIGFYRERDRAFQRTAGPRRRAGPGGGGH